MFQFKINICLISHGVTVIQSHPRSVLFCLLCFSSLCCVCVSGWALTLLPLPVIHMVVAPVSTGTPDSHLQHYLTQTSPTNIIRFQTSSNVEITVSSKTTATAATPSKCPACLLKLDQLSYQILWYSLHPIYFRKSVTICILGSAHWPPFHFA